jgi:hypothetical protein
MRKRRLAHIVIEAAFVENGARRGAEVIAGDDKREGRGLVGLQRPQGTSQRAVAVVC